MLPSLPMLASLLACFFLPQNTQTAEISNLNFRNGYRYMSETNMYYKEHNTATNWTAAIAVCKAEGGRLATPFTKNEVQVITILFTCKTFCSWVGIHDSDTEGTFTTLNGTLASNIYMKWQKGEPNNAGGQEDCVCMKKDGTYNDVPCDWVNTFMCTKQRHEVESSEIAENEGAQNTALKDYQYAPEYRWHYKVHREPKIWLDAVATCRAEGAQLAAPTTEKEVQAIASLHDSSITFFTWIGIHDSLAEGYFITLDGTPASDVFTKWQAGEPNDFGGCEDCIAMSKDGNYNDGPCHWNNTFICIKRQSEIDKGGATSLYPAKSNVSSGGCLLPDHPYKGRYSVANYNKKIVPGDIVQQFTILQYSCVTNYDLSEKFSLCQEDNAWSSSPECYKRCDMITSYSLEFFCFSPAGTSIPCSPQLSSGSTIHSRCKEGHHPAEPLGILTCHNGRWDKRTPKCKPDCGLEKGLGISYVINGFTAKKDTFPWHVAVYQDIADDYKQICGGSLVESHIVLSAAHCFYNEHNNEAHPTQKFRIVAGKFYRSWDHESERGLSHIQRSEVQQIILHSHYGGDDQNHQSDIAIVVLTTPFKFSDSVRPVCYDLFNEDHDNFQLAEGNIGKVAGWGRIETGLPSEELKTLNLPVVGYKDCRKEMSKYQFRRYLTIDKYCAGYLNGSALCQGDSGGGLVFPDVDFTKEVRWFLRGIVSNGPLDESRSTCRPNTYTAFTHVFKLRDWLNPQLWRLT